MIGSAHFGMLGVALRFGRMENLCVLTSGHRRKRNQHQEWCALRQQGERNGVWFVVYGLCVGGWGWLLEKETSKKGFFVVFYTF